MHHHPCDIDVIIFIIIIHHGGCNGLVFIWNQGICSDHVDLQLDWRHLRLPRGLGIKLLVRQVVDFGNIFFWTAYNRFKRGKQGFDIYRVLHNMFDSDHSAIQYDCASLSPLLLPHLTIIKDSYNNIYKRIRLVSCFQWGHTIFLLVMISVYQPN